MSVKLQIKPIPDANSKRVVSVVSEIPIFDRLDGDELTILIQHMGYLQLEEGEKLFEEGDEGDHVFFVSSGAVDVLKHVDDDESVALTCLRKGRSVGEMAMIDQLKRSATIRARERSNILCMSRSQFDDLLARYPALGIKILKGIAVMLSQNLRKTASRLADYMLPMS
jgi:CRP/FNR family cyclic AMP-dependent transcriptional regulator